MRKIDRRVSAGPVRPLVHAVSADPSIIIEYRIYTCRFSDSPNAVFGGCEGFILNI